MSTGIGKEVLKRFRLLRGVHADKTQSYKANDPARNIVVTKHDLVAMFGAEKFEYLGLAEGTQAPSPSSSQTKISRKDLEGMSVTELRQFANDEDIDIEGISKKDELVNAILAVIDLR